MHSLHCCFVCELWLFCVYFMGKCHCCQHLCTIFIFKRGKERAKQFMNDLTWVAHVYSVWKRWKYFIALLENKRGALYKLIVLLTWMKLLLLELALLCILLKLPQVQNAFVLTCFTSHYDDDDSNNDVSQTKKRRELTSLFLCFAFTSSFSLFFCRRRDIRITSMKKRNVSLWEEKTELASLSMRWLRMTALTSVCMWEW